MLRVAGPPPMRCATLAPCWNLPAPSGQALPLSLQSLFKGLFTNPLYTKPPLAKLPLDETEPFGYHHKLGGFPDLFNHLLAASHAMRKTKLTPLQNRIIWILEEAGEETIETLRSQGTQDEEGLRTALDGLQRLGLVSVSDSSAILTKSGYAALTK